MVAITLGVKKMKSRLWHWALRSSKFLDVCPSMRHTYMLVAWPWPLGLYIGECAANWRTMKIELCMC